MLIEEEGVSSLSTASDAAASDFEKSDQNLNIRCRKPSEIMHKNEANNNIKEMNEEHCESCEKERNENVSNNKLRRRSSLIEGIKWFKKALNEPEYIMHGNNDKSSKE